MKCDYLKTARPVKREDLSKVTETVAQMIENVRDRGDEAVIEYTRKLDKIDRKELRITPEEFAQARKELSPSLMEDMQFGINQVRMFAQAQRDAIGNVDLEITPGIHLGHRVVPISDVGAYIPGGRYPILSAAQMLIIPARVAGFPESSAVPLREKTGRCIQLFCMQPRSQVWMNSTVSVVSRRSRQWLTGQRVSDR